MWELKKSTSGRVEMGGGHEEGHLGGEVALSIASRRPVAMRKTGGWHEAVDRKYLQVSSRLELEYLFTLAQCACYCVSLLSNLSSFEPWLWL